MTPLALFLLLAASRIELVDEVYQIPASEWRYVPLGLKQRAALVTGRYHVMSGSRSLRLALLRGEDLRKLREGEPHGVLDVTPLAAEGALNYQVREPDDYVLVIDNQGRAAASVRIEVWVDFAHRPPTVRQLSPERQLTVVVISFVVFFGVVTLSARRLLRIVAEKGTEKGAGGRGPGVGPGAGE